MCNAFSQICFHFTYRGSDGKLELDLDSNPTDIINSEHQVIDTNTATAYRPVREYTPEYKRSLRVGYI